MRPPLREEGGRVAYVGVPADAPTLATCGRGNLNANQTLTKSSPGALRLARDRSLGRLHYASLFSTINIEDPVFCELILKYMLQEVNAACAEQRCAI